MNTRENFLSLMAERRAFSRGTPEHEYHSRAARKLAWLMWGIPSAEWRA